MRLNGNVASSQTSLLSFKGGKGGRAVSDLTRITNISNKQNYMKNKRSLWKTDKLKWLEDRRNRDLLEKEVHFLDQEYKRSMEEDG